MWGDFLEESAAMGRQRYEGLYEEEGYQLCTSAGVYVPWFLCTLKCRCEREQPMSELDKTVCKCILGGIDTLEDISFVLSLDKEITEGEMYGLSMAGILAQTGKKFVFTEKGRDFFHRKSKKEAMVDEYPVYFNGITGKWHIHKPELKAEVPEGVIRLVPVKTVAKPDIENHAQARQALEEEYGTHIISVQLLDYKTIAYQEEEILFYENGQKQVLFAFYDSVSDQLDTMLGEALLKKFRRREVLELMQAEKHLEIVQSCFARENGLLPYCQGGQQQHHYLQNREIRELLLKVMDEAEKEIFIISPWMNRRVVNDDFIAKIRGAVSRGVMVTIGYGYISEVEMGQRCKEYQDAPNKGDREWRSLAMAKKLQQIFSGCSFVKIFYVKEGTHEKILSYDGKYTLIGSYNLLSYDGGEQNNYTGIQFRYEGAILIEDASLAREVKERFGIL